VVAQWNRTHPDVQIQLTQIATGLGGGYAKMLTAIDAGNAPDLGQIEYFVMPAFVQSGGLLDLTRYGARDLQSQFVPVMWNQVALADGVYAIPRDSGPLALFYRADLFEAHQLPIPTTWAEFVDVARTLKARDPDLFLASIPTDVGWWGAMTQQKGAQWFRPTAQGWQVGIDDQPTLEVARYWQQLVDEGLVRLVNTSSPEWGKDLIDGKYLAIIGAAWAQLTLKQIVPSLSGRWRVAPVPRWGEDDSVSQYGGSAFAVFSDSRHPAEAAEFVKWLGTDPEAMRVVTEAGDYPATVTGQHIPATNTGVEYFGGQNIFPVFRDALNRSGGEGVLWSPTMMSASIDFSDGLNAAASGNTTLTEVFRSVQVTATSDMREKGYATR
jgi:multiple sugar transport system substrate-binding protein